MNFNIFFRNLDARRVGPLKAQVNVNINNNSTIVAVSRQGAKMNVGFAFTSTYEPNMGVIRMEGDLEVEDSPENIERAMVEWEASERTRLPKEMAETVHNVILSNCIVEASMLARDVKLPSPIPMPQVTLGENKAADTSYIR
jgi:hypothetical protein